MIEIDDAGWGSLVGGVLIGAYRQETDDFRYEEIPVPFFQGHAFDRGDYQAEGAGIAQRLLTAMDARPGSPEPITVCTGHVLKGACRWLMDAEYVWQRGKIVGVLQERIEGAFLDRVLALGVKTDYLTMTTRPGLFFYQCVQWLHGGNAYENPWADPQRETLCKTGWASYRIWADHPYDVAKQLAHVEKIERKRERFGSWRGG